MEVNMTDEQKKFLQECELEFANRYTDEDKEFMKIKTMELIKPPIVDPWYNKSRRSYDGPRQGGRRNHWERRSYDKTDRYDRHDRHSHRSNAPYHNRFKTN